MTEDDDQLPIGKTPLEESGFVMIVAGVPPRYLEGTGWPDPDAPEVLALREAVTRMFGRHPRRFPLRGAYSVGLTLRSADEFEPDDEGTHAWAATAVEEVLRDTEVLDEIVGVDWDYFEIDPALTDGYSIEIDHHPDPYQGSSPDAGDSQ